MLSTNDQMYSCRFCSRKAYRWRSRLRRRRAGQSKFWKLPERLPLCHSFTPPEIARGEAAAVQPREDFLFREMPRLVAPRLRWIMATTLSF